MAMISFNKKINNSLLIFFLFQISGCFFCYSGIAQNAKFLNKDSINKNKKEIELLKLYGRDGPYLINNTLYRVNSKDELLVKNRYNTDSLVVRVDNMYNDEFHFPLNLKYKSPDSEYKLPEKMVVISDIEGKYNAFESFLFTNKIIDTENNWIFGNGHLVLVGDFVDRGKNVTQVLWLIYKLEFQAQKSGGQVHFILGNHEVLNFHGNYRYNHQKYVKIAQIISGKKDKAKAVKYMYSEKSELGKWMASKNVIEKIGEYIFVHGGLSPDLLKYNLSLNEINTKSRTNYFPTESKLDTVVDFLYSPKGPFWYRGLVMDRLNYTKIQPEELSKILKYYNAQKIIIGHTLVNEISTDYNGRVIRIDLHHGSKKVSGKTKGLLIVNGKEYIIDDLRNKKLLE